MPGVTRDLFRERLVGDFVSGGVLLLRCNDLRERAPESSTARICYVTSCTKGDVRARWLRRKR